MRRVNSPAQLTVRVAGRRPAERQLSELGGSIDAATSTGVPGRGVKSRRDDGRRLDRAAWMASPTAAATAVTVGCASAAVSSSASRVCGASPRSRSVTRTLRSAGTGRGSDAGGSAPRRCSARAISRHIIGFPPVALCTRVSVGRASVWPSRVWMIRRIVPTLTGPTMSRSPGSPRSDVMSLTVPVR